jgi:two-component sensor histidine kinase
VVLGVIVNELATNAIKHGFTDAQEPRFRLSVAPDGRGEGYVLTAGNSGRPFPDGVTIENPQSLGLRLVNALVAQIGGTLALEREPSPTFTVRFPLR